MSTDMSDQKTTADFQVQFVEVEQLRPLRHAVLRPGLPFDTTIFEGDAEDSTFHAATLDAAGEIISIGSILSRSWKEEPETKAFQLRGMASSEKYRGMGAGKITLNALENKARQEQATLVWCKARVAAAGFYKKAGWNIVSDEFDIPEVGPHYVMMKRLE